ncbi:transposase family protein [Planosporangium thailandense]|uniref:Transposase family protein n=1 Tax=Planosporangium thailandense TaxID=765197 RepID=A0ABX0XV58_9ACTN|nr:transposase family protein [Planosporangium thailandense]
MPPLQLVARNFLPAQAADQRVPTEGEKIYPARRKKPTPPSNARYGSRTSRSCGSNGCTLIRTDDRLSGSADRRHHADKHHCHGVNAQVIAYPAGRPRRISQALPGSTHDLTAARTHGIVDALAVAQVLTFADKGYQRAGGRSAPRSSVITGIRAHPDGRRPSTACTPRSDPSVSVP